MRRRKQRIAIGSVKMTRREKSDIRYAIESLCECHVKANKFPFPTEDDSLLKIVHSTMPPSVLEAIQQLDSLSEWRTMLDRNYNTRIAVNTLAVTFRFSAQQAVNNCRYMIPNSLEAREAALYRLSPGDEYYEEVWEWANKQHALRDASKLTQTLVDHVITHCNTSGQVVKAWPELLQFMPAEIADGLRHAKAASRLPAGLNVLRVNDERGLATEFLARMAIIKSLPSDPIKVLVG